MRLKNQLLLVFTVVIAVLLILASGIEGSESVPVLSSSNVQLPIIIYQQSPTPTPIPTPTPSPAPIFVGLNARWDGRGYIYLDDYYEPGTHKTQTFTEMVDNDIIKSENYFWYDPNPLEWESDEWFSYYSVSTGWYVSSSVPADPSWKWGHYYILPYQFNYTDGEVAGIDGQTFRVSGPLSGVGAFGQRITYWRFVNLEQFLIRDSGDFTQYVYAGDVTLEYDINTRLLLLSDVKRHMYYLGDLTSYTVQYIDYLTSSTAYSVQGDANVPSSLDRNSEYHSPLASYDIPVEELRDLP